MFETPKPWLPEKSTVYEQDFFEGDDEKVRFYTGLHSMEVLMKTFSFVSPHVNRRSLLLSKFQEFVFVLINYGWLFQTKTLLIVLMFQDLLFHVFSPPG